LRADPDPPAKTSYLNLAPFRADPDPPEGAGSVAYENGDTKKVSESEYKRNQYAMGGMMLVIGIILWVVVANGERKGNKES
jgi:hypothetical protein